MLTYNISNDVSIKFRLCLSNLISALSAAYNLKEKRSRVMAHETANIKWIPSTRLGLWGGLGQKLGWGGLWGIIIWGINQCYSCTDCSPLTTPPPHWSTSRTQLPLRTVGHWCSVEGWRGSAQERERGGGRTDKGRDWEREEGRGRWRTCSFGTRLQLTARVLSTGSAHKTVFGCKMRNKAPSGAL